MSDVISLAHALAPEGQPTRFFHALDHYLQASVGHIYMTLLIVDGDDVARVYSSDESNYPSGGRKPMRKTPWGDLVLRDHQCFLARDRSGVRWAFFDHAFMESLGVGSAINVPVLYNGACLGTLNLNNAEHHYEQGHLQIAQDVAPLLIPAFLTLQRAQTKA
ncbi:GAF domain-containing protein [Bosea sp. AK1]|uniref:GAF domain-containing protein n=1 Tax=Bosea sp. AK1 TaxID=2587160 RepID=UPI0011506EB3|nr:GAF domain-containing protein [Bosea sp. AK1]TQI65284.1 GAF domain-containing protein [Bosea sp. AK1]